MTLYVAEKDLYFQEILKYFNKSHPNHDTTPMMLDSWKFFKPIDENLTHIFKTIAPYAVFEYLANTPKTRKNTLRFYNINKSAIEHVITHELITDDNYKNRQTWNDIQIKHSTHPLAEQKMIRDVLIYCSIIVDTQVESFVIQNFAHISSLIKIETDLQKSVAKYDIENMNIQTIPDMIDRIRITNFKDKSFPQLLIKSDVLTPSAYNKWYSYIFVKTYIPVIAQRLPKNLVLIDHNLIAELLLYSGSKFSGSQALESVLKYSDEIDKNFNNGVKIKPNTLTLGSDTYHIKTNSTLNDILDLIITDKNEKLIKITNKILHHDLKFHLENNHTTAHRLTDDAQIKINQIISKRTLVSNAKLTLLNLLNKHPLLPEILNTPLTNDDLLKINQNIIMYKSIISEPMNEYDTQYKNLLLFNTSYIQLLMSICLTILTKIESQTLITETKEVIKTDATSQQKIELLENKIQHKDNQIMKLSKDASRLDALKHQLEEAKIKIQTLEKELDTTQQIIVQPIYHEQTVDITDVESRLNNTDVTFVGGHQSWQANVKMWAPKATFIHPDEASRKIPQTTKILIINTGYLNHGLYYHTKNAYDSLKNCQLLYLNSQSTNKNIILSELSKQIKL